jgi:2-polyprenyl-3-methyl-5-hydroxy-6-metoxy-1,4-benzoquinol methylase
MEVTRHPMKKYYEDEHETAYRTMREKGIMAWDQYYDPGRYDFDRFMMRPFLERALSLVSFDIPNPSALEYGCGTGAASCFLANRGFRTEGLDLSPIAIELAQAFAKERELAIDYKVQDMTVSLTNGKQYDLIVDNYCLQSIVTDEDREALFANVRARLKNTGYYIIATAVYHDGRDYEGSLYDATTGILYDKFDRDPADYGDVVEREGYLWIPNRRHLTPDALLAELRRTGFQVVFQEEGNVICRVSEGVAHESGQQNNDS